ncbi:MAG: UDP-N-acetylmuramoyl-tripeptide--D-alanyl-D-alanine ligase [Spirochaetaceae bacterium]|jgi:UDP-N-acetylmuramoyl-tripeptide--D-alanyl-D-alanine ligase|nr:UDP-N-acetylmuramoyl-tripeptide--D-alanyl-D-alanine ligase [Spirochaetaceae bacterium]
MSNAVLMDYQSAALALGAELLPHNAGGGFTSLAIDSRKAAAGSLFIALRGLREDGHLYLSNAFETGAAAAMVTRQGMEEAGFDPSAAAEQGNVLFIVEDTLKGIQDLAAAYVSRFPRLLRIGITGSSGKTTTKEIAASIIGREKNVVMNPGNLNSETGLPLSVFGVESRHDVGIFEMGMNRKGEISELASVLKPRIALITNIGQAHIGALGSMEAIAEEKKQIFSRFTGTETALIPEDDPFRDYLAQDVNGRVVFYGQKNLEEAGKLNAVLDRGLAGTEITWEGIPAGLGLPGKHNVKNALAAATLATEAGISAAAIREGLSAVKGLFGRSEVLRGKTTVIRDCYNSNPDSAAEAVAFCDSVDWPGRRVYILGSMLELGGREEPEHRKIGELLGLSKADCIFLYGEEMKIAAAALEEKKVPFSHTAEMRELCSAVQNCIRSGDLVLLKGSRGCALEQLSKIVLMEETDVS